MLPEYETFGRAGAPLILLLGTVCADILQYTLHSLLFPFHKLHGTTRETSFTRKTDFDSYLKFDSRTNRFHACAQNTSEFQQGNYLLIQIGKLCHMNLE